MPFEHHGNRSFTPVSVHKNAPAASGVYGLSNSRQWLYIGESSNIREELLRHLQQPDAFLRQNSPSGFTFELSPPGDRIDRQNRLVFELEPAGNRLADQLSKRPLPRA